MFQMFEGLWFEFSVETLLESNFSIWVNIICGFVNQTAFEKEAYLKDLVVKLLKDRNLSDYDMLDSLFEEIKQELHAHTKASNSV